MPQRRDVAQGIALPARRFGYLLAFMLLLTWLAVVSLVAVSTNSPTTADRSLKPVLQGTSTPASFPNPIYTEQNAIDRALALFPAGFQPTAQVARLVTYDTLDTWRGFSSPDTDPGAPAWLVGVVADNLTLFDAMAGGAGVIGLATPSQSVDYGVDNAPVAGVYYAWDANGGGMVGFGTLDAVADGDRGFQSIVNLTSVVVTVVPATIIPEPTSTPLGTDEPEDS